MQISEAVLIFLIAELVAGITMIWRFAAAWGSLREADKKNHDDINNLGRKVRKYDRLTWQRIDSLEAFLQNRHDYNPPSLNIFDEDK